jgi:D-aminopeptidase
MGLPKDSGLNVSFRFKKGERNLITDVPGVKVGHVTIKDEEKGIFTGVTAVLPHSGNLFRDKVMAGASVINGFGKSVGLVQVDELGTIETPIMMTNTFGVGSVLNGTVRYMLENNPDIGNTTGTVNSLVTECNDWLLNDIRGMHVTEDDAINAIKSASEEFEEGAVGSGTGMRCMGLKGGIGSASRILEIDGKEYTLGCIVMSNFGNPGELTVGGNKFETKLNENKEPERGSIIVVLGTDIPLNERQLRRIAKRAVVGLARTGSYLGNGSGDIAIAFSNSNLVPHYSDKKILETKMFFDDGIDMIFEAVSEVTEESVLSALYHGDTTKGFKGHIIYGLKEWL